MLHDRNHPWPLIIPVYPLTEPDLAFVPFPVRTVSLLAPSTFGAGHYPFDPESELCVVTILSTGVRTTL